MTRRTPHEASWATHTPGGWLALALLFTPTLGRASEPELAEFSAPLSGCPGQAVLNERVAELAGESNVAPSRARVSVTRTASGYRTEVTLDSEAEARHRTFDTENCDAGVEAAALVIALGSWPSPTPAALPAELDAPHRPNSTPRTAARLIAEFGFDATALPSVAPTAQLGFSLAWRERYWLEALALGALPEDATAKAGRARFTLFASTLYGCYLAQPGSLSVGPCLGVAAYRVAGAGMAVGQPRSGAQLYVGPSGGVLVRWALTSVVALRASLAASVPIGSRSFDLNGARLYGPGKVDFLGAMGSDFRF